MKDGILEGKKINFGAILSFIALFLVISICVALYLGANEEIEESVPTEGEVTVSEMADYLHKLTYLVGPRNLKTPEGQSAIRSVAAMIDGTLGSANTGFQIQQKADPAEDLLWRTLWIEAGDKKSKQVVMITVPYGEEGHEVAFALGLGEYLTKHRPTYQLKLVFYPPLPEITPDWLVEHLIAKEENLLGTIGIHQLEADTKWATLSISQKTKTAPEVKKSMTERQWLQDLTLLENTENQDHDVEIGLHLDELSPRDGTPARFLRMLPVSKLIADALAR